MEEQLITFETAKLAKEKGWGVNKYRTIFHTGYYYVDDPESYSSEKEEGELCGNGNAGSYSVYRSICDAPTQSLLQKWLRKNHAIHIEIYCNASGWGYILTKLNGTVIKEIMDDLFFDSNEAALEIGLQEALKLI
jgi:hypothetical protein